MNAPERSATFLLDEDEGEVKIEYTPDTKVSNSGTFLFNKEDHTVGNLLRMQLLRDPKVRFAGYMMPHPLENCLRLKLQTTSSTTAPMEALSAAIEDLQNETDHLTTRKYSFLFMKSKFYMSRIVHVSNICKKLFTLIGRLNMTKTILQRFKKLLTNGKKKMMMVVLVHIEIIVFL